jgi:glycosyltransferase involved in cell wall biosynthesis
MGGSAGGRLRVATNFRLTNPFPEAVEIDRLPSARGLSKLRLVRRLARADAIVFGLPGKLDALVCLLARQLPGRTRVLYYDLHIPVVTGRWSHLKRRLHLALLRRADQILTVHVDTREHARLLRLPRERFRYVGFKSNIWEDRDAVTQGEKTWDSGSHVLACGRSYRDFRTFVRAMEEAGLPARILLAPGCPEDYATIAPTGPLPDNVEVVRHDGTRSGWVSALLGARIVVLPVRKDCINPAVSVYLEAMNLSRPVVISEGSATSGMLTDAVAGLVPPEDAGALARETLRLWNDRHLRESRVRNARRHVDGLGGVDRMSEGILEATLEACAWATVSAPQPTSASGNSAGPC